MDRRRAVAAPVLLIALASLALAAACSDDGGFDTSGTTTTSGNGGTSDDGSDGEPRSVFELDVGDCFDDPDDVAADVEEVVMLDCDNPHDNEVYLVFDFDADDFPGEEVIRDEALDRCIDEFESYVGVPIEESELDAGPLLVPTDESWEVGDREVVCAAWSPDRAKLEGSIEGSEG